MFESSAAAEEPDAPGDGAVSVGAGVMVERLGAALDAGVEVLRSLGSGTEVIAALGALPPGPLAGALLASVDPASLSDGDLIDLLKAQGRQIASLEAGVSTAMAAFAGHRKCAAAPEGADVSDGPDVLAGAAGEQVSQFAADEIAAALCLTRFHARDRMEHALDLVARLPGALAELTRGRIDAARARVIIQETRVLDEQGARAVEDAVLARAPRQTPTGLRASCRRAVLRADPAAAGTRQQQAETERTVRVYPLEDGMAELCWRDRADRVLAFSTAIEALAKAAKAHQPQDGRDLPQRRADVLADLGARLLELPWLPRGQGARPQVNITVPLGTMLNLSSEPAQLTGYGPIPAELARAIAAEGTWRRLLTDPATGALLDVGRDKYRPPAALREFVLTRDQYCQGLGCTRPARAGDIDHRIDWAAGGHTRASDLDALCRHTHQLKHQGGWTRVRRPDGATIWTTPTGHTYLRGIPTGSPAPPRPRS